MTLYPQQNSTLESPWTLSPQEQEEFVIQALENRLRQIALDRNGKLPRWSAW